MCLATCQVLINIAPLGVMSICLDAYVRRETQTRLLLDMNMAEMDTSDRSYVGLNNL